MHKSGASGLEVYKCHHGASPDVKPAHTYSEDTHTYTQRRRLTTVFEERPPALRTDLEKTCGTEPRSNDSGSVGVGWSNMPRLCSGPRFGDPKTWESPKTAHRQAMPLHSSDNLQRDTSSAVYREIWPWTLPMTRPRPRNWNAYGNPNPSNSPLFQPLRDRCIYICVN